MLFSSVILNGSDVLTLQNLSETSLGKVNFKILLSMLVVEIQNLQFLFRALAISLLASISVSGVYYEYLKKGGSWRIASQLSVLIPALVTLFIIFYTPLVSSSFGTALLSIVTLFVLLLFVGKLPRFKCRIEDKEFDKIENTPVFMCHERKSLVYNAWYDLKKKRIVITRGLFRILQDEERRAVLYHEIGHSKTKFWALITQLTCSLWLGSVSVILTMLILVWMTKYTWPNKIVLSTAFLAFLPMYAISFMISSWVNEHEADSYAARIVGFKPKAQALIKLHVYNSLKGCESTISCINFSDSFELGKLTYFYVLKTIIRRIFRYLDPRAVLNQPLPETHPPLRLRLEKIVKIRK